MEGVKQSGISPLRRSADQSRAGSIDPPYWELDKSQSISVDIAHDFIVFPRTRTIASRTASTR